MVPCVHSDKSVSVFCVNCNDTAARLHRSLLRRADRRSLVIFCVRWWGAPLIPADEFGPVVFPDYLRSMSVVKTLKTTAFYELTKVISQVRRAKRLRNAANSKIYRRIWFRIRHICFLFVTESLRTDTYDVTKVFFCFLLVLLLLFSCSSSSSSSSSALQLKVQQHHLTVQRELQLKRRLYKSRHRNRNT